ncbi:hypothetical protein CPLU01_15535, partial [Colletotrichum plurivorum]
MTGYEYQIDKMVVVNEEHCILICKLCKAAVRPGKGIEGHFRTHWIKGTLLQELLRSVAGYPLEDPKVTELPNNGSRPVSELPIRLGLKCQQCRFAGASVDVLTRHRKKEHLDTSPASQVCERVKIQSWMTGSRARYWVVNSRVWHRFLAGAGDMEKHSHFRAIEGVESALKAEQVERLRKGDREEGIDRDSSWVKRVQWVRHFGSRDLITIHDKAQWIRAKKGFGRQAEPDDESIAEARVLTQLAASFDREVLRCCDRLEGVPTELLQALQSISAAAPSGQPFRIK